MSRPVIYTIGHSTHPIEYFLELLKHYNVNCVVDVRSLPASRFNPQYNKKALSNALEKQKIKYLHFGEEFGARQTDPDLLDEDGKVDFEKMRNSEKFKKGIDSVWREAQNDYVIALMCSESEPLNCHRFSMISLALKDFQVKHILKEKSVVSQKQLEDKLLEKYSEKLPKVDLFKLKVTRNELLNAAYRFINKEVAYSPEAQKRGFKG